MPESNTPWGRAAREFRIHHDIPRSLNEGPYTEHVFGPTMMMLPVQLPLVGAAATGNIDPNLGFAGLIFTMVLTHSMEIHRQAHLPEPNKFIKKLQDLRILLGKKQHNRHHVGEKDTDFQVVNGWTEPMMQKFAIWEALDRLWWKYRRVLPHNWVQEPSSMPADVREELLASPELIPQDLEYFMQTYPKKLKESPEAQELIDKKRQWLSDYREERETLFLEMISDIGSIEANKLWRKEQRSYPHLYGGEVLDLVLRDSESE